MPKMSLYLPDDLWDAAQQRKEVNWSQVFQRAVKAEVFDRSHERRTQPIEQPDLDALMDVDALRQQFTDQRAKMYRKGYEIGVRNAHSLHYADMHFFEHVNWEPGQIRRYLKDDRIWDALHEAASEYVPIPGHSLPFEDSTSYGAADVINDGFADALRRIWELVMDESRDSQQQPNLAP